ncbi:MAG TPA: zf-HC2 domain-containing protein [Thermoanaerobaculia bacterium]|nr:zf-HC2 domain-containing protein [Thermoanaerobaculia bacterium]
MPEAIDRHPPPETLVAYHERRLSPQEAEEIRAHLAACPDCTTQLLELAVLFDEAEEPGAGLSREELDDAWERQRRRLFPAAALPFEAPMAPVVPLESRRPASPPRRSWVAAASMGLAAALLGMVVIAQWRTIERLRQPQANPPLVNLVPVDSTRRGTQPAGELELPADGRVWMILNPASELGFPSYDVELVDADGKIVLRFEDVRSSEEDNFRLEVPEAALKAGDYRVLLFGRRAGQQRQAVEEFRLKATAPSSAMMKNN